MAECDYSETYFDVNTGEEIPFKCHEDAYQSDKCKLHLERYLEEKTKDEVKKLFLKKLDEVKGNESLLCIGYILPCISLLKDKEKEFKIPVYFAHAKFKLETLNFSHIPFKKEVSFYRAKFFESTNFRSSVFKGPVDFSFSEFHKESNSFESTKFKNSLDFSHATLKNANFEWANFCKAEFIECKFFNETVFENVTFSGDVYFKKSEFSGNSIFSESTFSAVSNFEDAKFLQLAAFSKVNFNQKENITFNGNISNVSFADTDIKKINFGNKISWEIIENSHTDQENNSAKKKQNNELKIYEERLLEENDETQINLESIKNIYRDLRDNFDLNLRYDLSGKFFVREMELKRKYREKRVTRGAITQKKPICHRTLSLYWLYNILAQYGQSYYRPICFAVPIIFIGTLFFWVDCSTQNEMDIQDLCDDSLLYAFIRSLSSFIPFFTFAETPNTLDYVLRLVLLPISGTFFIALKRRFEKKLRH